jgi:hypothetical protein
MKVKFASIIIILTSFFGCNDGDNSRIDSSNIIPTTDTIFKYYSDGKVKEVIISNGDITLSNFGFDENGDTINYPKVTYDSANRSIYLFVPLHRNYSLIEILFENMTTPGQKFDSTLTIRLPNSESADVLLPEQLATYDIVRGFIKTTSQDKNHMDFWPFTLRTK